MKFFFWSIFSLGCLLFFQTFLGADESFQLQRTFVKGRRTTYATLIFQRFKFPQKETGEVKITLQARILLVYDLTTKSVGPKNLATLEWKFRRIYLYRWQAGMMFVYDTAKKDKKYQSPLSFILNLLLRPLVGKTFQLKMNSQGEILKIQGAVNLFQKALNSAPPAYRSFLRGATEKLFSPKAIRSLLRQTFPLFPKDKIKIGGQWKESFALPRLGALAQYQYTFLGAKKYKNRLRLVIQFKCIYQKSKDSQGVGGYEFLKGGGSGKYVLDKEGRLLKMQNDSTLEVLNPNDRAELTGKEVLKSWITHLPKETK